MRFFGSAASKVKRKRTRSAGADLNRHVGGHGSPRNLFRGLVLSYLCGTCCQRTGGNSPVLGVRQSLQSFESNYLLFGTPEKSVVRAVSPPKSAARFHEKVSINLRPRGRKAVEKDAAIRRYFFLLFHQNANRHRSGGGFAFADCLQRRRTATECGRQNLQIA